MTFEETAQLKISLCTEFAECIKTRAYHWRDHSGAMESAIANAFDDLADVFDGIAEESQSALNAQTNP